MSTVLVELHDLRPGALRELDAMERLAARAGASRPLLLVTPEWGGRSVTAPEAAAFSRRLRETPGEVVLHGLVHDVRAGLLERALLGAGSGSEFARAGEAEAAARLERGRALLESWTSGRVRWFCAPRWRQSRRVPRALARLGFAGHLSRSALVPVGAAPVSMPAVCLDHGTRRPVVLVNHLLTRVQVTGLFRRGGPFRLTIHPRDLEAAEIGRLIDEVAARGYRPVSLEEALSRTAREAA